jgi:hypothetical protein
VNSEARRSIKLTVPGGSPDLTFEASHQLIDELNSVAGPIASKHAEKGSSGSKGDPVTLGTIILAAISAGVAKQVAGVLISYIKRNPKYVIEIGQIKITKDYATAKDVNAINAIAGELGRK